MPEPYPLGLSFNCYCKCVGCHFIWLPQQSVILIFVNFLQDVVNAICDDEDIKAISFVGSNIVSYLNRNNLYFLELKFQYILDSFLQVVSVAT